jgi:hypothetical protein
MPLYAAPVGKAPPMPMSFHQVFFSCDLPLEVTLQATVAAYEAPEQKIKTRVLIKGDRVRVVDALDIVRTPGLAKVVDPNFEHNDLGLRRGDEVYVLADWEMLYSHAWVEGREVDGGLPVQDTSYFSVVQEPIVEHWVLVHSQSAPTTTLWTRTNIDFCDRRTIDACKRIPGF